MLGWKIFTQAVAILADNLPAALRLSLLPYAVLAIGDYWVGRSWPGFSFVPGNAMPAGFAFATLLVSVASLLVWLWVTVAWTRHLLLAERVAGWIPPFHKSQMGTAFFRMLGLGLAVAAAILIVGIVLAPLSVVFGVDAVMTVSPFVGLLIAAIIFYRLGLVLPSVAIDREVTYEHSWSSTAGLLPDLAVLAGVTLGLSEALALPITLDGTTVLTPFYSAVTGWISLMLGATVLAVFYANRIEGRRFD